MHLPLLVLASVLAAPTASALTFQTRLERVEWNVEGDVFECRLSQPVAGLGAGEFVRRAGEQAIFRVRSSERWFGEGNATLLAAAAPWQPSRSDVSLGQVRVRAGEVVFDSSPYQAGRLLSGLLEGRSPVVRHRTRHGGEPLEVRLLPARFAKAYEQYLSCAAELLPVNFEQVRETQLSFPNGGTELGEAARARLDVILRFLAADPSVNRIQLDGHSDNSGDRLTNRELSRQRALAVREYLVGRGIDESIITVRFHGERYPLVANNSAANRARNRRVSVQLERGATIEAANEVRQLPAGSRPL